TVPYRAILKGRRGQASELSDTYFRDGTRYCREAEAKRAVPTMFDMLGIDEIDQAVEAKGKQKYREAVAETIAEARTTNRRTLRALRDRLLTLSDDDLAREWNGFDDGLLYAYGEDGDELVIGGNVAEAAE
ncbi:hypothetical protein, partial [Mesorhizobium sp. M7A.F.Ca.CA.004.11.1.1]